MVAADQNTTSTTVDHTAVTQPSLPDSETTADTVVADSFIEHEQTTADNNMSSTGTTMADDQVSMITPPSILDKAESFVRSNPLVGYSLLGMTAFLGITFVIALFRTSLRGFSKEGKRSKTINKNKAVIDELGKFLPDNRAGLNAGTITGLRIRTGFSPVEIFRKYLWYLLRERKFDTDAVADVVALRSALKLREEDVAVALKERAQRVYDKYGNVMLDTSGMSAAGIERKATARALFSKMLYLVENEDLISTPEVAATVNLRDIFGATEDDVARLRIASLYDVDLEKALELSSGDGGEENGGET